MSAARLFSIIIVLTVTITGVAAQNETADSVKKKFKNQGEQEDYWAETLFKENHTRQDYKKYAGEIIVKDKNHIRFGKKILRGYFSPELKSIFTEGIFYPQLMLGDSVYPRKSKEELSKMTGTEKLFYNVSQNDTLTIGNFEELKFLSTGPTIKRFRFWYYRSWSVNPYVYFMELTNIGADKSTDLPTFIKGATLTFLKGGWLII